MRYRRLGSSGPSLSTVGFGAWAAGGGGWDWGWGPQDDADSIAAIRRAVESGVNWVDTAAVYGLGHSEEVTGRALRPFPDVFVFTKCGLVWDSSGKDRNDLSPDSIRWEAEQSLRRLAVDHIDLYQFHWPDDRTGTPVEESWQVMADLIDEGKVRFAGVSNFDVDLLERCEAIRHVDSLQPQYNLLHSEAAGDVIPWCRAHGTGVIGYSPMASGLLTGAFSRDRLSALPLDDWRRSDPDFADPAFGRALAVSDGLGQIAARLGVPQPALAVAWALHTPGVTGAICGARRPAQVDDWLPAAALELDDHTRQEITALG